ncbi:MAG: AzlC family ABC transporter permease [Nocardiopsaceae bacterium]|nr:AzlC family ABC transporter permease [Nocardiopsaceae bacterium]
MSPSQRTIFRDIALVCLADALVAASFGATATSGGLPPWVPVVMSLVVFAGGAQIAAVSIVLAGGGPIAAVAAGALLNSRLLPYGFAVADITGAGPVGRRLFGAHVTTDESVAFALRQRSEAERRFAFWACGITLFLTWNAATVAGTIAGTMISDTGAFGLDATFPAVMLALALPAVTDRRTGAAAGTGAIASVALTPVLPAGLPVLVSLGGLACLWPGRPGKARGRADPGGVTGGAAGGPADETDGARD